MVTIITSVSRFTMIILFAIYTYYCFATLKSGVSGESQKHLYHKQALFMILLVINANLVLFLGSADLQVLFLLACELIFIAITMLIYKKIYQKASYAIVNNMCMLLNLGFIILTRIDIDKAMRQFVIAVAALILSCFIPLLIHKLKIWNRLSVLYAVVGIIGLLLVLIFGKYVYGAKLNITLGAVTIQPSEFIKILFVFFVASMLYQATDKRQIIITSGIAAIHVLILVACRDLGGAGIFFITYLIMLYVATKKIYYLFAGSGLIAIGLVLAYFLFSHVRTRVVAWIDPLSVADKEGYQICQSLFAIGTGGWFGSGLYKGMPNKIPVVAQDFVFSAISEEFGAIFALCLIFVCVSCSLMFFSVAMEINDQFYKLTALGLGTVYSFQVFLTLGGVTKFIPSTGVTLPLISYGGSSLLSTMILFAVVQGLYVKRNDEGEKNGKRQKSRV